MQENKYFNYLSFCYYLSNNFLWGIISINFSLFAIFKGVFDDSSTINDNLEKSKYVQ